MSVTVRRYVPALVFGVLSVSAWPAQIQTPFLPHFFQVNDHVYRGAQPTGTGWDSLAKLGVKTVIDLRREGEDGEHSIAAEAKAVEAAGMHYINVPMNGIVAPGNDQISRVLTLLDSPEPVFVHCKKGKDRTGTVIACYRIAHDRWTNQHAMDEAKSAGLHWMEVGMKRYVEGYRGAVVPVLASQTGNSQGAGQVGSGIPADAN
jgi:tyrosine-protein phosphatase SIW14